MPAEIPNLAALRHLQAVPPAGQEAPERARRAAKQGDEQALRKASQEFESIFVNLLLKEMRKSMPKGGVFERSMAREWFEGMLDEAVSKEVVKGPGIGLAGPLFEQMRQVNARAAAQAAGAQPRPPEAPSRPETEEKEP